MRIADDGEIQVKGVYVFAGYWKNQKRHQGDLRRRAGSRPATSARSTTTATSQITGRKKEIIVTAGGKNVAPAALEDPIRANPIIGQVVVVGDQKPFISALITLDDEMLPVWLQEQRRGRRACR